MVWWAFCTDGPKQINVGEKLDSSLRFKVKHMRGDLRCADPKYPEDGGRSVATLSVMRLSTEYRRCLYRLVHEVV